VLQGFVFPLGVYTAAANELWKQLPDLEAMRVVTAALA
jgi:tellurite resistance protein TehA-like permease